MRWKNTFKEVADSFVDLIKIMVISAIIVIPIRYFLFQPFFVKGASMEPNFKDGEYLIIDEITYRFHEPERGDVIVFKYPNDPKQYYIKRIIGLPGEAVEIKDGDVYIYDKGGERTLLMENYLPDYDVTNLMNLGKTTFNLEEGRYFVMGDNRVQSSDSRSWGDLKKDFIVGRVVLRAYPFSRAGLFLEDPQFELVSLGAFGNN